MLQSGSSFSFLISGTSNKSLYLWDFLFIFRRSSIPFRSSLLGFPISPMAPDPNRAGTSASANAAKDDAVAKKKVENEDLVSPKPLLQIFARSRTQISSKLSEAHKLKIDCFCGNLCSPMRIWRWSSNWSCTWKGFRILTRDCRRLHSRAWGKPSFMLERNKFWFEWTFLTIFFSFICVWNWNVWLCSRQEIRTSTSSMTSVPKPLKFLRPHYGTLKTYYETMAESDLKV